MTPKITATAACVCLAWAANAMAKESDDAQAIRRIDAQLVASLNAQNVDRWLSYFASDAQMWPPCAQRVVGREAIRDMIEGFVALPNFAVAHHIESVVVADSGDLAFVTYTYEMFDPVTDRGKDVTIYRKGSDGSWKLHIDMWSPNGGVAYCQADD